MDGIVVVKLSEKDRLNSHIPEWLWKFSRDKTVFVEDTETGDLVQVLDCTGIELDGQTIDTEQKVWYHSGVG